MIEAYFDWVPSVERLAPVLVEVDYQVDVPDPDRPEMVLRTHSGDNVRYRGRVDMLAIDEHDAYWILRHHVVEQWTPIEYLLRDEESLAACWAWERFYLGMQIAGTISNELRIPADFEPSPAPEEVHRRGPGGVRQSVGSGGGRSIPQHRRLDARSREPESPERVTYDLGPWFRRIWIRRSPEEIEQAGRQLAEEARQVLDPGVVTDPSPSVWACPRCAFAVPCQALYEGRDAEPILTSQFHVRDPEEPEEGRLGGIGWSTGRGAAPPRFPGDRRG